MDHLKQDLMLRSTSLDNHYVYVASSIKWISYLRNSRTTPSLNSTVKRERKKIGLALGRSFLQEEEAHSLDDIRFSSSLLDRTPRSLRELVSPLASLDDKDQCHNGTLPPR